MIASHHSTSRAAFNVKVDTWIAEALADGIVDYDRLLRRLPGVHPTELLVSLDRLAATGSINPAIAAGVRCQTKNIPASSSNCRYPIRSTSSGALSPTPCAPC